MVYEGRGGARRRQGRARRGSVSFGKVCMWLLIGVVAAWAVFPGTMRALRDRAAGALGVDIGGAIRAWSEERDAGAGVIDAAGSFFKAAFDGGDENGDIPVSETPEPTEDLTAGSGDGIENLAAGDVPALGEDGADGLADLPLPKFVSMETPEMGFELTRPCEGEVTAGFGFRRGADGLSFHYGADLGAAGGETVRAMASGEVMAVGDSTTYGKYVILSHEGGVESIYAHLGEALAAGGETVEAGAEIGKMDDGGGSLHVELIVDGMYVDPMGYLSGEAEN